MRLIIATVVFVFVGAFQQAAPPAPPGSPSEPVQAPVRRGPFIHATPVAQAEMEAILGRTASRYPKFYALYRGAMANDKLITSIRWMRATIANSAGSAQPNGVIILDPQFLEPGLPGYDDNRLVVVIEHEIGHLHYFQTVARADWTPDRSEQAAFEYSLQTTKAMAEKGDCGPLKTGVIFMKLRSEGMNLEDPHVRALKRMVTEPLYASYVEYVAKLPACQAVTVKVPERGPRRPL